MKADITRLKPENIDAIVDLAKSLWHEHYTPIIGKGQVEYMLEKFQSHQAIKYQMEQGYQYYQVTTEAQLLGYFSIQMRENESLFISKFYLDKGTRGKGIGKQMLCFIEDLANSRDCKTIDLTVNKCNSAYKIYLKLGFINQGSAKFDIGNDYVMDDYLMSKNLQKDH